MAQNSFDPSDSRVFNSSTLKVIDVLRPQTDFNGTPEVSNYKPQFISIGSYARRRISPTLLSFMLPNKLVNKDVKKISRAKK